MSNQFVHFNNSSRNKAVFKASCPTFRDQGLCASSLTTELKKLKLPVKVVKIF